MPFAGSNSFLEVLLSKKFRDPRESVISLQGSLVTEDFFSQNGFTNPILIPQKEGLQIKVPDSDFSVPDIAQYVGLDFKLDVIDVRTQDEVSMSMQEFAEYYYSPDRSRLLNVLSMEFSKTNMSNIVTPPRVVSHLSLVETCWPPTEDSEWEEEEGHSRRPSVQKYCLMSMGNSYTDFHIDFGGSSVWYHVLWGEKIFYLIPPTRDNLRAYRSWFQLPHSRSVFFPDFLHEYLRKIANNKAQGDDPSDSKKKRKRDQFKPDYELMYSCPVRNVYDNVYKMTISGGNTVLLPSGWIHAVYTPVDSIVFGGNFMHPISIPLQLTIYRMEKKLKTDKKFMFPYFEKLHWFVAERILAIFKNYQSRGERPPFHYLEGGKCLIKALSKWLSKRKSISNALERSYYLPDPGSLELPCNELLKQLNKVITDLNKCKASASISVSPLKGKAPTSVNRGTRPPFNSQRVSARKTVKPVNPPKPTVLDVQPAELEEFKVKRFSVHGSPSLFQLPEDSVSSSNGGYLNDNRSLSVSTIPSLSLHSAALSMPVLSPDNVESEALIHNHWTPRPPSSLENSVENGTIFSHLYDQRATDSSSLMSNSSMKLPYTPPLSSSSKTSTPYSNPYDFNAQDNPDVESGIHSDETLKTLKKKKKKKKKRKKEKFIYEIVRDTLSEASRMPSASTFVPMSNCAFSEVNCTNFTDPIRSNDSMTSGTEPSTSRGGGL